MTATHPKPFVVTEAWLDHNQVFVEGLDRNSSVPLPQPIALALIAAAKAGIESDWQTIESAPKDGTTIWVACKDCMRVAYWNTERESWWDLFGEFPIEHRFPANFWTALPALPSPPVSAGVDYGSGDKSVEVTGEIEGDGSLKITSIEQREVKLKPGWFARDMERARKSVAAYEQKTQLSQDTREPVRASEDGGCSVCGEPYKDGCHTALRAENLCEGPEETPDLSRPGHHSFKQWEWLKKHPEYQPIGPPRPGVCFTDCGTLYADGRFEPSAPMKPIRLEPGCVGVGKKVDPNTPTPPVGEETGRSILDEAHLVINALGGAVQKGNVRDEVYNEAIGDALAEIEKLGGRDPVNLTVLRNALLDIVARGPGTEPENPRDEFGYFRGSGNEGDIADDVRAWERWEAAQIAGRALFNTRPDGAVDEDTKPPTPEPSDPSPDSVAGSVSRRADLNCEPSCNSPSNGLKPQPSPDLDMEGLEDRAYELIAHDADCSSHGRNDNCCNCGVVEFLNDLDTALKTLRGELEKPDTGKEFLSAANKYQSFLIERLEAERDSLKEHVERLLDLIKRVEQRWSYSPPVVEQELRKEMRTALKGGR